ncbi:MAG: hypothetical protein LBS21_10235 [Clostridiales bacterium]|nr:hypothetical protein [Clostridiales bacterium]
MKKKYKLQSVLGCIAGLVIAIVWFFFLEDRANEFYEKYITEDAVIIFAIILFTLAICFFTCRLTYELGHLIFGLISNYRFNSFVLFGLKLKTLDYNLKLESSYTLKGVIDSIISNIGVSFTLGRGPIIACSMLPPDSFSAGQYPFVLYLIGGFIANFTQILIAAVLYIWLPKGHYQNLIFASFTAIASFFTVVYAIEDVNKIKILKSSEYERQDYKAYLIGLAFISSGGLYENIPPDLHYPPRDYNGFFSVAPAISHSNYLIAKGDYKAAKELDQLMLEKGTKYNKYMKDSLKMDLLYWELIGECRKEIIDMHYTKELQRVIKLRTDKLSALRVRYAYERIISKDEAMAKYILAQFNDVLKNYPYPGDEMVERRLISEVDSVVDSLV